MGFDNGSITDSVTGNDWTLGKSTSMTDSGKVGKGFVTAGNGVTTATQNDGNNYGDSAENVGLYNGSIACWYNVNGGVSSGGSHTLKLDLGLNRIGIYVYIYGNATSTYTFKGVIKRAFNSSGYFSDVNLVNLGITNSEYVYLAITWSEDRNVKMFVNGELQQTWVVDETKWNEMISQSSDAFGIDHGTGGNGGGSGLVDEVGFWNRALTEEEVKNLYDAGVAEVTYPFSGF